MDREALKLSRRVREEAVWARSRYQCLPFGPNEPAWENAVRPLVERIVELEESGREGKEWREAYDRRDNELQNVRDLIPAGPGETTVEAARRVMARVKELEAELEEVKGRHSDVVKRAGVFMGQRNEFDAPLCEERRITAALRSQIAALEAQLNGGEEAIRDACEDARRETAAELASATLTIATQAQRVARLETALEEMARLVGRRAG